MFFLRIILFLFVAGSMNVVAVLLAYTLPALSGWHLEAVAVTAGFILMADVICLYILFFRRGMIKKHKRYSEFEDVLNDKKTGDEVDSETFEEAYRDWKDKY